MKQIVYSYLRQQYNELLDPETKVLGGSLSCVS